MRQGRWLECAKRCAELMSRHFLLAEIFQLVIDWRRDGMSCGGWPSRLRAIGSVLIWTVVSFREKETMSQHDFAEGQQLVVNLGFYFIKKTAFTMQINSKNNFMLDASPSQRWARSSPPKFCYANHAILSVRQAKIIFFRFKHYRCSWSSQDYFPKNSSKPLRFFLLLRQLAFFHLLKNF